MMLLRTMVGDYEVFVKEFDMCYNSVLAPPYIHARGTASWPCKHIVKPSAGLEGVAPDYLQISSWVLGQVWCSSGQRASLLRLQIPQAVQL